eukprot:TRINITY_DN744_c0_g1_i10.p1 TRINITY_DN744_c0_g1~~TRINITY_DN744_c0_g1_i10.p1  ORF type:complete len:512 (+),score=89.42 TRINITY_DN744_c0_g1_i10:214-1536(+)
MIDGLKFSGSGTGLTPDISTDAKKIMENRRVEVTTKPIFGQLQIVVSTFDEMVEQLKEFPELATNYPIPIYGIFNEYKKSIPYNWQGAGEANDYQNQEDVLYTLSAQVANLKDRKSNLQYIQKYYDLFEEFQVGNESDRTDFLDEKSVVLKDISQEINQIKTEIAKINRAASSCVYNIKRCSVPSLSYESVFELPEQQFGDVVLKAEVIVEEMFSEAQKETKNMLSQAQQSVKNMTSQVQSNIDSNNQNLEQVVSNANGNGHTTNGNGNGSSIYGNGNGNGSSIYSNGNGNGNGNGSSVYTNGNVGNPSSGSLPQYANGNIANGHSSGHLPGMLNANGNANIHNHNSTGHLPGLINANGNGNGNSTSGGLPGLLNGNALTGLLANNNGNNNNTLLPLSAPLAVEQQCQVQGQGGQGGLNLAQQSSFWGGQQPTWGGLSLG